VIACTLIVLLCLQGGTMPVKHALPSQTTRQSKPAGRVRRALEDPVVVGKRPQKRAVRRALKDPEPAKNFYAGKTPRKAM